MRDSLYLGLIVRQPSSPLHLFVQGAWLGVWLAGSSTVPCHCVHPRSVHLFTFFSVSAFLSTRRWLCRTEAPSTAQAAPGDHEPLIGGARWQSMGEPRLGRNVTWSFCGWTIKAPSVLASEQVGAWDKRQPVQMTNLHLSSVLSSMFPGLCIQTCSVLIHLGHPALPSLILTLSPISTSTVLHVKLCPIYVDHKEHGSLIIIVLHKPKTYLKVESSPFPPNPFKTYIHI
jgi:hypothetical protein